MRNLSIIFLLSIFTALLLLYNCSTSQNHTGYWDYTVKIPGGNLHGIMDIQKDKSRYSGFFYSESSDTVELSNVELEDSQFSSFFNLGTSRGHLAGTFIEDRFDGNVQLDNANFPFTATRHVAFTESINQKKDVNYKNKLKPVQLIFDSDFGPDYDDVGALAILHAMADRGEVEILATIASTKYPNVAPALDVVNTYFQRPDIPIAIPTINGVDRGDPQHWSDTIIVKYPHDITSNDQAESATALYRKILASNPDSSVTIVTVGFLTNMVNLLNSGPDKHSSLNGVQLVSRKVKELVSMAGWFPRGREFNVFVDAKSSIYTFENWPTDVIFSGFEIGVKIKSGIPLINNDFISSSPVKDVYRISIPMDPQDKDGRMSWDQTAVLFAIRGPKPFFNLKQGRIIVEKDGSNTWDSNSSGHYHLVFDLPFTEVQTEINELMMHVPVAPEDFVYQNERVKIIMDKDAGPDGTEYTTLSLANKLHNIGRIELLAITNCTPDEYGIQALHAINKYHGNSFPIGQYTDPADSYYIEYRNIYTNEVYQAHKSQKAIVDKFGGNHVDIETTTAKELYRKTLVNQPDKSVVIMVDGQHFSFHQFIKSEPDDISPLTGLELLEKKVKRVVMIAGIGRTDNPSEPLINEWNIHGPKYPEPAKETIDILRDQVKETQIIWFQPFIASGDKTGYTGNNKKGIIFQRELIESMPDDSPVKHGYLKFFEFVEKQGWHDNGAYWLILDEPGLLIAAGIERLQDFYEIKNDGYPEAELLPDDGIRAWWTYSPDPGYKNHYYVYVKPEANRIALEKYIQRLVFESINEADISSGN